MRPTPTYRYLNQDGLWPGFSWQGLELDANGVLRLIPLPRAENVPADVTGLPAAPRSAGLAVDRDGTIYFTDPDRHAVYRVDGCSGEIEPAPCFGGKGNAATRMLDPAGLVIPSQRPALYVADAGNGRVQVFDLATGALIEILDGFDRPVSLATDDEGNLYVVDTGADLVNQLTSSGDVVQSFSDAVRQVISHPVAVAVDGDLIYVLDGEAASIGVFDHYGRHEVTLETGVGGAVVFSVIAGSIYVGDPTHRRLVVFRRNQQGVYALAGEAIGYQGPVAALSPAPSGGILLLPGHGHAPLRLTLDGSHTHEGWLWSGVIQIDRLAHYWNRLHASLDRPPGTHMQFFVFTGSPSSPPPSIVPPGVPSSPWRPMPGDANDFFLTFDGLKTQALWIAVRFSNDLHATPALEQVRVDFDQDSYLPFLPAIYRERDCDDALLRYLSLFESCFQELEAHIDDLSALVDPEATDATALPWLAGFLALALPQAWSEANQREAIAGAYQRYARRGTVRGLRETLRIEAGVRAWIDEPLQAAGWWAMPGRSTSCTTDEPAPWTDHQYSVLGVNTVLATAEPQGAVVGTTATLDRSQLISQEEYGTPLCDALAYRFTLYLFASDVACAETLDQVTAIVDREKPAHTAYDVCVIKPGIRIGYQARLGIDTLLGGGRQPGRLGDTQIVLAGQPPSHLGVGSHLGVNTRL